MRTRSPRPYEGLIPKVKLYRYATHHCDSRAFSCHFMSCIQTLKIGVYTVCLCANVMLVGKHIETRDSSP